MREDDGQGASQGAADGADARDAFLHVGLHLFDFLIGQPSNLVEEIAADVEFADIVQQGRNAYVLHALFRKTHVARNLCRIHRNAIGMVLRVLIVRNVLAQDLEHAIVGLTQIAQALLFQMAMSLQAIS
jgi:hypothetical protein